MQIPAPESRNDALVSFEQLNSAIAEGQYTVKADSAAGQTDLKVTDAIHQFANAAKNSESNEIVKNRIKELKQLSNTVSMKIMKLNKFEFEAIKTSINQEIDRLSERLALTDLSNEKLLYVLNDAATTASDKEFKSLIQRCEPDTYEDKMTFLLSNLVDHGDFVAVERIYKLLNIDSSTTRAVFNDADSHHNVVATDWFRAHGLQKSG